MFDQCCSLPGSWILVVLDKMCDIGLRIHWRECIIDSARWDSNGILAISLCFFSRHWNHCWNDSLNTALSLWNSEEEWSCKDQNTIEHSELWYCSKRVWSFVLLTFGWWTCSRCLSMKLSLKAYLWTPCANLYLKIS